MRPKIILKPGRDASVRRFHPWVFSGAIARMEKRCGEGDVVDVCDSQGNFLGSGHSLGGTIAVKLFTFEEQPIGGEFWLAALRSAYRVRELLGLTAGSTTTAYRLVHGEGDNLPGLIIDIYGTSAVVQFQSPGMFREREHFVAGLKQLYGERLQTIYQKPFHAGGAAAKDEDSGERGGEYLLGQPPAGGALQIREGGFDFLVDWEAGQKTGFFLDQRENRAVIQRLCRGRSVLNTFSYTGGFSVYALGGGASRVVSVDSSARAVEQLRRNIELNFGVNGTQRHETQRQSDGGKWGSHEAREEDVFRFLAECQEQFDCIILDPPAFAKRREAIRSGEKGYTALNTTALKRLPPGGLLATFSCSQLISRVRFRELVFEAAAKARRQVRVLYDLRQAPCHPVSIFHPEGEYLKGLVLAVE